MGSEGTVMAPARSEDVIREHLLAALEHLLTALAAEGGLSSLTPPVEALDAALGADRGFQKARTQLRDAMEVQLAEVPSEAFRRCVLALEEVANYQAVMAVEVGWRVGVTVRTQDR